MKLTPWILVFSLGVLAPLSAATKTDPNAAPANGKATQGKGKADSATDKGLTLNDIPPPPPHIRVDAIGGAAFGTAFMDAKSNKVAADKFDTLRKAVTDANVSNLTSLHSAIRTAFEAYQKVKSDNDNLSKDADREKARVDEYQKQADSPTVKRNRTMESQAQEKVKVAKDNYGRLEESKKKSDADVGTAVDAFNAAKDAYNKALGTAQPAIDAFKTAAGF
jgi:hypothetical protein